MTNKQIQFDVKQIKEFINFFYMELLNDDLVAPVFSHIPKNELNIHLERVEKFWLQILQIEKGYKAKPMLGHLKIIDQLNTKLGDRWLSIFEKASVNYFDHDQAVHILRIAQRIMDGIQTFARLHKNKPIKIF